LRVTLTEWAAPLHVSVEDNDIKLSAAVRSMWSTLSSEEDGLEEHVLETGGCTKNSELN
jgi:hypothetical protein